MAAPRQIDIKTAVMEINQSFFIPDIQRSYVWLQNYKDRKIEKLFDSLMRGFPIGAFLFWRLDKSVIDTGSRLDASKSSKLNFQLYKFVENYDVRKPHNAKIDVANVPARGLNVVLDGQQRLTSLFIGLRGSRTLRRPYAKTNGPSAYPEKFLHINLRYEQTELVEEERYQFEFLTHEEANVLNETTRWFQLGLAMGFEKKEDCWAYAAAQDQGEEDPQKKFTPNEIRILLDLYDVLHSDISYFEETEKDLEKVLAIFIRTNSGGTALSYSDLLMSILTATFQSDIRQKMEAIVDHLQEQGFGCVGRDQILKTSLLLTDSPHFFKLENFNRTNIAKIENNWDAIIASIEKAVEIIAKFGYKYILTSGYIVATLAYYIYTRHIFNPSDNDKKAMQHFVRLALIGTLFSSRLDSKLAEIRTLFKESQDFTEFLRKLVARMEEMQVSPERLVNDTQYGTSSALPVLQILYPDLSYGDTTFHIDHIYPKSKFNEKNEHLPDGYLKKANYLFNLQLLRGSLNESKKDKDPEKWLAEVCDTEGKREAYFKCNHIPEGFRLDWERLPEFEEKRKEAMLKALRAAFKEYNNLLETPEHEDGALTAD